MVSLQAASSMLSSSFPKFQAPENNWGKTPQNFKVFQCDLQYITKMKVCEGVSEITYIASKLRDLCIYMCRM